MRVTGIPYVQGHNSYADRDSRKYGIAIHNTSNDASAESEAAFATRRPDGVSAHFYCDRDSVIQSLDTAARAGHAGSNTGNENAVAVEITGVNGWSRQQWLDKVAWDKLGATLRQVCAYHGIAGRRASVAEMQHDPKVRAFYSHDDMRRAWGGTDHTDPGPDFPWDRLFSAVNGTAGGNDMIDMTQPVPGVTGLTVGQWMADTWIWEATQRGLCPVDASGAPQPRPDDRFKTPTFQSALLAAVRAQGTPPAPVLTDEQAEALADKVSAQLGTSVLTVEDVQNAVRAELDAALAELRVSRAHAPG